MVTDDEGVLGAGEGVVDSVGDDVVRVVEG